MCWVKFFTLKVIIIMQVCTEISYIFYLISSCQHPAAALKGVLCIFKLNVPASWFTTCSKCEICYIYIDLPPNPLSMPSYSTSSLSLRFPHQNPAYTSSLPHTFYMPRPSYFSHIYQPINIRSVVQVIKLLIMFPYIGLNPPENAS